MFKPKIAIFGASGFVGSALVERLFFDKDYDFRAFIHSFGNAARIARLRIKIESLDILDYHQVKKKLHGCNVVVNCSRGGTPIMMKGLKNIVKASIKNKIKKFIHIGSIAIYGDNPTSLSKNETASPNPGSNSYGVVKLKQDKMIFGLHASGVPSVILCPSNISGPYSPFVLAAAHKLLSNEIALIDDGIYPTNLIHVDNLVEAILSIVESEEGFGERYFVNEVEKTTWKEFYEELKEILHINTELRSVSRDEVLTTLNRTKKANQFADYLRILKSREFRDTLSVFPAFKKINEFACNTFNGLNPNIQNKLRQKLTGPIVIKKESTRINLNDPHIKVQVRQIYHSPQKIISKTNYTPLLNYQQRKETAESWLKFIFDKMPNQITMG